MNDLDPRPAASEDLVSRGGTEEVAPVPDASLAQVAQRQDAEAAAFAAEFLKKVIRIRGVRIDRADFLRQELRKLHLDDATVEHAIASTPVQAGIPLAQLDELASAAITFETGKSAALSFSAGLPGGFALLATVPADLTQYYVHAFRVMQKIAYLYGWQNFIADLDDVDDQTLAKLALFLGVMMGVGGASASLGTFAVQVARPALQKQITSKALTKTVWYGPVKSTLKLIGIKVTKDSFAKTVTKAVPVAGGVISGSMTLVSLRTQSGRLKQHLRELPPPGLDAAEFHRLVSGKGGAEGVPEAAPSRFAAARAGLGNVAGQAATTASTAARGAAAATTSAGGGMLTTGRTLLGRRSRNGGESGQGTSAAAERGPAGEDDGLPSS